MPRKFFRKYLPSHESIRENRYIRFFGTALHHPNLWHLNRKSVAGGTAVGLFCGLVPGPLQMLSAALFAILFRVNLPVAVILTWYTNPFTIVPLYYIAYKLGMFVTGGNGQVLPGGDLDLLALPIRDWIPALYHWIAAMGRPFVLGLFLLALILAVAGYLLAIAAWRVHVTLSWNKRRRTRMDATRK
ncbi:MAG TPA: DUF2062 domain-containing protein [Burkholderiales bacterium]|nr:DUF2062 domain-containing protein [Burkholderiales bacterium]